MQKLLNFPQAGIFKLANFSHQGMMLNILNQGHIYNATISKLSGKGWWCFI